VRGCVCSFAAAVADVGVCAWARAVRAGSEAYIHCGMV
jgi:hypothetical protein